jgi:hypothetical protein
MRHENLFIWICVFLKVFFQHHIHEQIFNTFILHPISFELIFNSILELISIQFKLCAMSFNIFFQMEFNFHKVNYFFHQLTTSWLSLVVHGNMKPKQLKGQGGWGKNRFKVND